MRQAIAGIAVALMAAGTAQAEHAGPAFSELGLGRRRGEREEGGEEAEGAHNCRRSTFERTSKPRTLGLDSRIIRDRLQSPTCADLPS